MKVRILVLSLYLVTPLYANEGEKCIPKVTEIEVPKTTRLYREGGNYLRTSPDGKMLLVTTTGKNPEVVLYIVEEGVDGPTLIEYETPMKSESYPIEPNWDFIISPYHGNKSHFYKTSDLIQLQERAKPKFQDEFTEYYHSAGGDKNQFRVVNWSFLMSKKYKVENGKITPSSDKEIICYNLLKLPEKYKGVGEWAAKRSHLIIAMADDPQVEADFKKIGKDNGSEFTIKEILNTLKRHKEKYKLTDRDIQMYGKLLELNRSSDNSRYSLINPIISPNGKEIAGIMDGTTKIYTINPDNTCTLVDDLGVRTSKVSFSYPDKEGKNRYVVFNAVEVSANNSTQTLKPMVYDRNSKQVATLSSSNAAYVNLTEDNQAIVFEGTKIEYIDIFQYTNGRIGDRCITKSINIRKAENRNTGDTR